jgi:hypothetical protein
VTIQNGFSGPGGGGIRVISGMLTLRNSTVTGNVALRGGGIFNGSTLTLQNSTVIGNQAFVGGGGILNTGDGTLTVLDSTIADNSAGQNGGGILNTGRLTVVDSTLAGNSASDGGGIFNQAPGAVTLAHVTFENNTPNDCTGCP